MFVVFVSLSIYVILVYDMYYGCPTKPTKDES
jgi:hypothetical protein